LDHTPWTGLETVVDIGSGPGNYVTAVQKRAKHYIAGDLSAGMLANIAPDIPRIQLNAQRLPLAKAAADVVLANHMLYHLPKIEDALQYIKRVLRPDGRLIAATNSSDNMAKLKTMMLEIGREISQNPQLKGDQNDRLSGFSLENGQQILTQHFAQVDRFILDSALIFPAAEPVIDYVDSMRDFYSSYLPDDIIWSDFSAELARRIRLEVKRTGKFRVGKKTGVFICYR
jgi:SAM-dependent methyltransferase